MVRITIRFVDGSLDEFEESDHFLLQLNALQIDGYKGKELINELITDDWGPPPLLVEIKGIKEDGTFSEGCFSIFRQVLWGLLCGRVFEAYVALNPHQLIDCHTDASQPFLDDVFMAYLFLTQHKYGGPVACAANAKRFVPVLPIVLT